MNHAVRMVLEVDSRYSITSGLISLDWLKMDNLWRLEQIMAMKRICQDKIPELLWEIIVRRTQGRYMIRSDGLRSSWWPRNTHGEHAFIHQAVEHYNLLRIGQRHWYSDLDRRMMTKSEVRKEISRDLAMEFGNENLH